jgi:N-acetylglucosaminyldiphosphoundecaprenol N-acetyl-beta-D-mannosaminyltransferase
MQAVQRVADPVSEAGIPQIDLLGMRVSRVTRAEGFDILLRFIESGRPHLVVTADASAHVIAASDPEFRRVVAGADLVTPDGTGLLWASRRLGNPLPERVSGVDLAEQLCAESARRGFGIYFFGAAPGVAELAAEQIRRRYPGANIVGTAHGFRGTPELQQEVLDDITARKPAVLLVAMGIPRQEKWIAQHLERLSVPVCMGVGGTFDVFSGRVSRAPVWMQKNGLEWLYRLLRDPRKYSKVATLPVFALRVLRHRRLPAP